MKVKELIDLLDGDPDATVRVSIEGEKPQILRAVARAGNTTVLMAVPKWQFSELDEAMEHLGAAVGSDPDPGNSWWTKYFYAHRSELDAGRNAWYCRTHNLPRNDCQPCREGVPAGWHWGFNDETKRFCNCHTNRQCADNVPDPIGEAPDAKA